MDKDLPVFEQTAPNVTAFVGQTVYLPCRVRNLRDKVVSFFSPFFQKIFFLRLKSERSGRARAVERSIILCHKEPRCSKNFNIYKMRSLLDLTFYRHIFTHEKLQLVFLMGMLALAEY